MSSIDNSPHTASPRSRSRNRLAVWLAVGIIGLALGAVWATGFATIGAGNTSSVTSPALTRDAPTAQADRLANVVSAVTPLDYTFEGYWGSVPATTLFKVDLKNNPAHATGTFNVALLLGDKTPLAGWSSLQFFFEEVEASGPGDTCDENDFDETDAGATKNGKLMRIDSEDAGVYWNGLPGGHVYCLGIGPSDGRDDSTGQIDTDYTLLHSASETTKPTQYPLFLVTVDRAS